MIPLLKTIKRLENEIENLSRCLPFADGQAYYNDKERITEAKVELSFWRGVQDKLMSVEKAA